MTDDLEVTIVWEKVWEAIHKFEPDGTRTYKYIILKGSSRSGKTYSLIDIIDLYCRSEDAKRCTVWRNTKTDCKQTVLFDTEKHLRETGRFGLAQVLNKTESIFTYATGSRFEIHGTEEVDTVMGLTQDVVWLNEPYKISRDIFDQLDQRTSDFILIDLNPKIKHWVDDLEKDSRALVIHSTFRDNPFCPIEQKRKILSYQPVSMCDIVLSGKLSIEKANKYDIANNPKNFTPKQIKELSRCIENEYKKSASEYNWKVFGLGQAAERPNRIFRWKEIPISQYNEIKEDVYYGVDWGAVDPWGIVEVKYYDGALYVNEINYKSENEIRMMLSATERSQIMTGEEGFVTWYFRKFGITEGSILICDDNRPKKIAALRLIGYNAMKADKGSDQFGNLVDSIDFLNDTQVYYTSTSTNLAFEQENYSRKIDRYGVVTEEPEDANNHLIDPIRYVHGFLRRMGIIRKM
jgi:PBSX family phage terminase large subunit